MILQQIMPERPREWVVRMLSRPVVFGSLIPAVTLLNAMVGMLLPQMMEPRAFGTYSLVVTLFSYGLIFDLGVSQLIDRWVPAQLAANETSRARQTGEMLLWLRLGIGVGVFLLTALVLLVLDQRGQLPFGLDAGLLAALAGLADMVALGPVCIYRSRSQRRNYALMIFTLLSGLVVARLGGLMAGGITGCFAALATWYMVCAVVFQRSMPLSQATRPSARKALSLIGHGLPFFATSFIWAFYVTANRWVASFLLDGHDFGQFAFSANIFSLLVGALGGFSAFYYPKIAGRIANSPAFAQSGALTRDLSRLVGAVAIIMAVGIILAGVLVRLIYPSYLPSVPAARIILVAVPPMVLASWLMPVSQSSSTRPWIDGVIIFPLALLLLVGAIIGLDRHFGVEGIAWASTISALPLIAVQLIALHHTRIIRAGDAALLFAVTAGACVGLGALSWSIGS